MDGESQRDFPHEIPGAPRSPLTRNGSSAIKRAPSASYTAKTAPRRAGSGRWERKPSHLEAPMPKMKTNRAAAKRFRVTGSGRIRRSKAGCNHMMQEKSRKRLRRLRKNDMVDKSFQKRIKLMLPYG